MGQDARNGKRERPGEKKRRRDALSLPPRKVRPSVEDEASDAVRLIVGLGASAGGLDAFKAFFRNLPPSNGMTFVLIQHLDPQHKSLLVELLGGCTTMPVVLAEEGMAVAADHVYIIPPNAVLTIAGGVLHVITPAPPREFRRPIDSFFVSLAEDQGEHAVCIILSGSGSDGTRGLTAIKEHGGFTMAQSGADETALLGMPSSAVATGLVDCILPVEAMPARLLEYQRHLAKVTGRKTPDGIREDAGEYLVKISALIRARIGHDFSEYKDKTLIRRVQRRMQVLQIDSVPDYIERLRTEPGQIELLFRDLLIGVTQFFRDPQAFAALQHEVMPKIIADKGDDDTIRIWVPGCSTGEEAISIAIVLREAMVERDADRKVQIFATDLDEQAVAAARTGRYRKPITGVSPDRLARWFVDDGVDHCPIKAIRDMCVFSIHNLIKDPPFSKLDLIACRNVMIYLNGDVQDRLLRAFHYALRRGGYLFLGGSEGIGRQQALFGVVDKKHRIFERRDAVAPALPNIASGELSPRPARQASAADAGIEREARRVLEKYSPAYVIINRRHEVVSFSGGTGRYMDPSPGAASWNLFNLLHQDLKPVARAAVQMAIASRQVGAQTGIPVATESDAHSIDVVVEPLSAPSAAEFFAVFFLDRGPAGRGEARTARGDPSDSAAARLERELHEARQQLQTMVEELETANEELKSSNEEYQSVNEELQSSNEELETSKEELTSINEELQTINSELSGKNEALTRANSDVKNVLDSTEIAVLFLDADLRIKNFTPPMAEIFSVRDVDRGRPITDIASRLSHDDLRRDVRNVLRSLTLVEREVAIEHRGYFILRIRPYRTLDNVIDGVVITMVDITDRKRHEQASARMAAIVKSSSDAVIGVSFEGVVLSWNPAAESLLGYAAEQVIGRPLAMLLPISPTDDVAKVLTELGGGGRADHFETRLMRKDGKPVEVSLMLSPVFGDDQTVVAASMIARDIGARRRADEIRNLMVDELNHRVKNTLATVQSIVGQALDGVSVNVRDMLDARLVALSRTHDLLTKSDWEGASLRALLLQELEPFAPDGRRPRFTIDGEDLQLTPKAALALGMVFHEIVTNAAKFGALSNPTGQVHVAWDIARSAGSPVLRLRWQETGGPPVEMPTRKGFGSKLIERGLALELDASVKLDFDRRGLRCAIDMPLVLEHRAAAD